MQLTIIDRLKKRFHWSRLTRMRKHYDAILPELVAKDKKQMEEIAFFTRQFEHYARKTNRLSNYRYFFYAILYASLFVNLLKIIPFLSFLVTFIELGSAIFGTTIAVIAIFLLTLRINLNLELMQDCLTHLIVIYHQNPKRKTKEVLVKIAKAI